MKLIILLALTLLISCASQPSNLYNKIGGEQTIERIATHFVDEIGNDEIIVAYFEKSNVDRFHQSFKIHLCSLIDGPCKYEGDDLKEVHRGMNITEGDFNRIVDLLINAMRTAGLTHRERNRVLARVAPFRGEIIYQ